MPSELTPRPGICVNCGLHKVDHVDYKCLYEPTTYSAYTNRAILDRPLKASFDVDTHSHRGYVTLVELECCACYGIYTVPVPGELTSRLRFELRTYKAPCPDCNTLVWFRAHWVGP